MADRLRWGDLPVIRDTESGIAAIEREQMTKPRPLDVEGPSCYQPLIGDYMQPGNSLFDTNDECAVDGMTRHTIQLLQYSHQMTSLIEEAEHQLEQIKSGDRNGLDCPAAPLLPAWQPPPKQHPMIKPFAFIPDNEDSLFVRGIFKTPPSVLNDETTCNQLLRRSVAAICAHAGFESCNQSVLDTLTDVCHEYFRQMLSLLRAAVDGEAYHGGTGFPDAITRVFQEMGLGKLSSVYDFYQTRVVSYHSQLLQKCIDLQEGYENLLKTKTSSATDEASAISNRNKYDVSSVIQFPSTSEAEETGDSEQMEQLEGLGMETSIGQTPSAALSEESGSRWKLERHEIQGSEDRMYLNESSTQGGQTSDAFHLPSSQHQSDSKRNSVTGSFVSNPPNSFLLKPPAKKFKK